MRFGVADYGMTVWDGGQFDLEHRLTSLKAIGYEGIERLEATSADEAVHKAAIYRKLGMAFGTVRGPTAELSIRWAAALGVEYIWTQVISREFDPFCRQVNTLVEACRRAGIRVGLHNHLNSPVETQEQVDAFLARCPGCGLILDTAHLAAAGGDAVGTARRYADRLLCVHLKDWLADNPDQGLRPGRFCELGAGNIRLDNVAVMQEIVKARYDGWVFIEQDHHQQDPLKELTVCRQYLRDAGF